LRKTELNYEIEVISFKQLYDLKGDRTLLKQITTQGEGVVKPSEGNEVQFDLNVYLGSEMIYSKHYQMFLNSDNMNEGEMIILKSLKKKEKSRIIVSTQYITGKCILEDHIKDIILSNKEKHVNYEIELTKFKQNLSIINSNGITIQKILLNKGLGNQCPWKNSSAMIALHVIQNQKLLYSDFVPNHADFINNIKNLKREIKQINKYQLNLQFIVNEKTENFPIYNTLYQYLPDFISEGIASMKLLEAVNYKFTGSLDFFKVLNTDIELINQQAEYDITVCLINFQESFNLFNKSLQTEDERLEKVKHLRNLANYYFSQKLFIKAKKINNYLADEYVKYVNLKDKNKLSYNQKEVTQTANIDLTDLSPEIKSEFRKSHSNLILILFNLKEYKLCNNIIDQYFISQDKDDEKVNFYKYKVLYHFGKFKESKYFLEKLCEINKQSYTPLLSDLNKLLDDQKKKKNNFIKKMFKFSDN
jgi:hypothetical protein